MPPLTISLITKPTPPPICRARAWSEIAALFSRVISRTNSKSTPNLTLNLGLRYEYYSVAHEILDRSAVVDIQGCGGFCPKGTPYYDPNYGDFGPRLSLAWAPPNFHGKTVFRTGYGIYYGGNQNDDFSDPAESAVPRYSLSSSDFPALSYPLVAFLDPKNQLFSPKAIDRHRKDLSYQEWDVVVQQQLPGEICCCRLVISAAPAITCSPNTPSI